MDNCEITKVEKREINNAKRILATHVSNVANNNLKFECAYKSTYNDDYSFNSLKRSKIIECICEDAKFISAAFTGSIFEKTNFVDCDFANASLDFCLFYNCKFFSNKKIDKGIINANLGNTNFVQCEWKKLPINKSVLSNSLFEQNFFDECTIEYSSFENTIFQSCEFKNMELRNINLEFSEFINPIFKNTVLPFAQIPYTFGLLENLIKNKETVFVSSGDKDKLSINEYLKILPQIIPYYAENEEFFPISNIYVVLGDYEKAFQSILNGMRKASYEKDFRMLKHFCKLAVSSGWCNREKIKILYSFIYNVKNFEPMIAYQRHNYYLHLGDFRKILLFNDNMSPTLNVQLQTNILPNETENIGLVIESLNQIISIIGEGQVVSSFELHHESPYEIIAIIIGGLVILKLIAENIHSICEPIKDIQEIRLNNQQIKINEAIIKESELKAEKIKEIVKKEKEQLNSHNIKIRANTYITNYYIQENQ